LLAAPGGVADADVDGEAVEFVTTFREPQNCEAGLREQRGDEPPIWIADRLHGWRPGELYRRCSCVRDGGCGRGSRKVEVGVSWGWLEETDRRVVVAVERGDRYRLARSSIWRDADLSEQQLVWVAGVKRCCREAARQHSDAPHVEVAEVCNRLSNGRCMCAGGAISERGRDAWRLRPASAEHEQKSDRQQRPRHNMRLDRRPSSRWIAELGPAGGLRPWSCPPWPSCAGSLASAACGIRPRGSSSR
jgi:hypothetical protein